MSFGVAKWRAGLKFAGSREFTMREKKELNAIILKKALFSLFSLASIPGVSILLAGIVSILRLMGRDYTREFVNVMGFALPIFLAGALTFTVINLMRVVSLFRDLRNNRMESYEGRFDENTHATRSITTLIRNGLFYPVKDTPQTMEVLAISGLIWSVNGVRQRYWLTAPIVETAEEPSYAAIAADWVMPLDPKRNDLAYVNQRQMTSDEKTELIHYIRVLLRKNLLMTLLMNAWFAYSLVQVYIHLESIDLLFIIALFIASTWDIALFTRLMQVAKFKGDLKMGILVIARMPDKIEKIPESQVPPLSTRTEFLPISRYLWSREGIPATWRITPLR